MSLEDLNAEQRAAVLAPEQRVLVLAGAGSGKTRTLVEKAAHLIESGISGYDIVCTTFTRAAAGEMRRRLEARVGREARKVTLNTFHGIGLSLLRRYGEHIGLRYGPLTVYTPLEVDVLLKHCGEQLGIYLKGRWTCGKREMEKAMSRWELGEDAAEAPFDSLFKLFRLTCLRFNALPYSGLIHGLVALAEAGKVRRFTSWRHFLVDEVQDLDPMQWRALDAMLAHSEGSTLFAVGDISQSIYTFRGAVPGHVQSLIDRHSVTVYELRSNYRSNPGIVDAANMLIRHNVSHRVLEMDARRDGVGYRAPELVNGADSARLAGFIAGKDWQSPPTVLCRNNRMLDRLSAELTARGVEHRRIGKSTSALHTPLFVKAHAALKCCVNPYDETAFLLAHKGFGLDAKQYAAIRVSAAERDMACMEVYRAGLPAAEQDALPTANGTVAAALGWFVTCHYQFDPADGDAGAFFAWLREYAAASPDGTLAEYLDWLALADVQDEVQAGADTPAVQLMTCHASKGLEFPVVIVAGCNEGVMPSAQAVRNGDAGIEDERRLMYVAVTRARDCLMLAVRPQKKPGETPSRFVREMYLER